MRTPRPLRPPQRATSSSPAPSVNRYCCGNMRRRWPDTSSESTPSINPMSSRRRSPRAASAARGPPDARPPPEPAAFVSAGIEVRGTPDVIGAASDLRSAIEVLLEEIGTDGYLSVHAYVDRIAHPGLAELRPLLARRSSRPVTFGWGPRFLHSTGQYHKGGPARGVFLQITHTPSVDLIIPDRPFTFGQLITAQASGDASVLAEHGRPVLTLTLTDPAENITTLCATVR